MANPSILVSTQAHVLSDAGKREHWVDVKGTSFRNPWPSWRPHTFRDLLTVSPPGSASAMYDAHRVAYVQMLPESAKFPSPSKEILDLISIRKPTWGADVASTTNLKDNILATWLGHACFLVEMPKRSDAASRGVRILFDPVFSDRCSPSQLVGPKRYTRTRPFVFKVFITDSSSQSHLARLKRYPKST